MFVKPKQKSLVKLYDTVSSRDMAYAYSRPGTVVLLGTHYLCVLSSYFMCLCDVVSTRPSVTSSRTIKVTGNRDEQGVDE